MAVSPHVISIVGCLANGNDVEIVEAAFVAMNFVENRYGSDSPFSGSMPIFSVEQPAPKPARQVPHRVVVNHKFSGSRREIEGDSQQVIGREARTATFSNSNLRVSAPASTPPLYASR